jgi:hypothetical protein
VSFNPQITFQESGGDAPVTVPLAPGQDIRVFSIVAEWDGSGSSGDYHPAVSLYSQDGKLLARTRPEQTFAQGDSGVVTYAPFLHSEPETAPVVAGSPPFTVLQLDGSLNVFEAVAGDPPGTPTAITNNSDGGAVYDDANNPVLSPDGSRVAFMMAPAAVGRSALFTVANAPSSSATLLLQDVANWLLHPSWSPDGTKIVYTRGIAGAFRGAVEVISASGGAPTVLYTPAAANGAFRPAYNHDGTKIAFLLDKNLGAGVGLIVMNADGSGATQIATINAYRFDGSQFGWANNADVLAYDDGASSCFVINADGTGQTLVNTGGIAGGAVRCSKRCWLPDDSAIVVTCNAGSGWQLFRLALDGSGSTLLNAAHAAANQGWMKQAFVHNGRLYFIEGASGTNEGLLSSVALVGNDYRVETDLTAGSVGDFFYGGTGFEWQ